MSYDSGDPRFGKRLESYGATFRGSPFDDAPAIQEALDDIASDGKLHKVTFPEGGLTAHLGTAAGNCTGTRASFAGLSIPSNLSVDFNGCTLTAPAAGYGSGDTLIVRTAAVGASDSYSLFATTIERGILIANGNMDSVLHLSNTVGDTGPANTTYRQLVMKDGFNILLTADNVYGFDFEGCAFSGWNASGWGITSANSDNMGELMLFRNCAFFNGAGGVLRARGKGSTTYMGYRFIGGRMDYVRQWVVCDAAGPVDVSLWGVHLEGNEVDAKYAAANHVLLSIADAATESKISLNDCPIVIINGGTGNTLAYVCNTGNTAAVAPYGITMDRCYRQLSGVTMDAGSTGRFADNS